MREKSQSAKILIVEDSSVQRQLLKMVLETAGYSVVVAKDGEEGFFLLTVHRPDLVISDINMPKMNGYEFCEKIKNDKRFKDIPVMLLTQLSDSRDIIKGLNSRADNYLTKPYDGEYLLKRVEQLLIEQKEISFQEEFDEFEEFEVFVSGEKFKIKSDQRHSIRLLLSTYENSVKQNEELFKVYEETSQLGDQLIKRGLELQKSEKSLSTLMRTVPDIIYHTDEKGCITFLNHAIEKLGYQEEELLGKHFNQIAVMDWKPEDKPDSMSGENKKEDDLYDELLYPKKNSSRGKGFFEVKLWGNPASHAKEFILSEISSTGLFDTDNNKKQEKFIGTVGVIRDVTQRKKVEEELNEAKEELQKRVKEELYRELKESFTKLKETSQLLVQAEKLSAVGVLAAGVIHDLNNPLMGISNFTRFCLKNTEAHDKRYPVLRDTLAETDRCVQIVKNLLNFSRSGKGSDVQAEMREMKIADLFEGIIRLLSFRIEQENIQLQFSSASDHISARVIPQQIQQVFLNLLTNAVDSMAENKLKIIKIFLEERKNKVKLTITDTGSGIRTEHLEKIFDPFYTTKPPGKGTGLGLPICRSIIRDHGGEICVDSQVGKGTVVTVYLPRK
ncbi:MAG: response regulator [Deltaproteobacteria bacterium]|nr:response regulator [Deltaproteobacteria bacterium]